MSLYSLGAEPAESWKVGDRVLAPYFGSTTDFRPGKISALHVAGPSSDSIKVDFDGGGFAVTQAAKLRPVDAAGAKASSGDAPDAGWSMTKKLAVGGGVGLGAVGLGLAIWKWVL